MALSSNVDEEINGAAVATVLIRVEFGKKGSLTFGPAAVNTDCGISGSGGTVGRGAAPAPQTSGMDPNSPKTREATKEVAKAPEIFMGCIWLRGVGFDKRHDFHVE